MKKVLAIAFIGGLAVASCTKKPNRDLQDSNTMMPEPDAPAIVDSTARKTENSQVNAAESLPANQVKPDTATATKK